MKVEELEIIKDRLAVIVFQVCQDLESFRQVNQLSGRLGCGAWIMGVDKAVASWVSYLPHSDPNEEAIEIEFFIDPRKSKDSSLVELSLGWSHGINIKEYVSDGSLQYTDGAQLVVEAEKVFEQFRNQIVSDMKNEMCIERQPVYREE